MSNLHGFVIQYTIHVWTAIKLVSSYWQISRYRYHNQQHPNARKVADTLLLLLLLVCFSQMFQVIKW